MGLARGLLLLALAAPLPGLAATLRVCIDSGGYPPLLTPDHRGTIDTLLAMAAADIGLQLSYSVAPLGRCQMEMKAGLQDAFSATPYRPDLFPFLVLPSAGGKEDRASAVTTARNMVFRRKGSAVDWDGVQFKNMSGPVLAMFGGPLVAARLRELGVAADDNGKTNEANFAKLLAGRGDLAIAIDISGQALLKDPAYRDSIEMLPIPFTTANYYIGVTREFAARHPGVAQQLWLAVARVRQSPQYAAEVERILAQAAKAQ